MPTEDVAERTTSFDDVYATHYARLVRLAAATTMSVPLAEEIVQEAFLAAYQQWPRLDSPEAWLRRAVLNRSISWIRRQITERRLAPQLHERGVVPPESETSHLLDVLRRLPARQRAVVFLKYYEDLTEEQIAAALGCAVGTVKSRLNRAREAMRRELA
jgi:RNA polymerase sigma-70 factor (sigma-E family)